MEDTKASISKTDVGIIVSKFNVRKEAIKIEFLIKDIQVTHTDCIKRC